MELRHIYSVNVHNSGITCRLMCLRRHSPYRAPIQEAGREVARECARWAGPERGHTCALWEICACATCSLRWLALSAVWRGWVAPVQAEPIPHLCAWNKGLYRRLRLHIYWVRFLLLLILMSVDLIASRARVLSAVSSSCPAITQFKWVTVTHKSWMLYSFLFIYILYLFNVSSRL